MKRLIDYFLKNERKNTYFYKMVQKKYGEIFYIKIYIYKN